MILLQCLLLSHLWFGIRCLSLGSICTTHQIPLVAPSLVPFLLKVKTFQHSKIGSRLSFYFLNIPVVRVQISRGKLHWMSWSGAMNLQLLNNSSLSWTLWATAVSEMRLESHSVCVENTFYVDHVPAIRYLLTKGRSITSTKLTAIKICCKHNWECRIFSSTLCKEMYFSFFFSFFFRVCKLWE